MYFPFFLARFLQALSRESVRNSLDTILSQQQEQDEEEEPSNENTEHEPEHEGSQLVALSGSQKRKRKFKMLLGTQVEEEASTIKMVTVFISIYF